jgi:8-oxoguanine deaminase
MLIHNALTIWTGSSRNPRLDGASIRTRDGEITDVGRLIPTPGEEIYDATDCVVAPGWVNTHHHFFQSLLKAVPGGLYVPLSSWSKAVSSPFRPHFDAEIFRTAVQVALYELVASGCTTVADHQFLSYPGISFDPAQIIFEEAERFGIRMVLCRGGMTVASQEVETLPAALRPENIDAFIEHTAKLAHSYHDASDFAFRRIVVAPTLLTSRVRREDLSKLAEAARALGLRLHSHMNETQDDNAYCREHYGCSTVDLCEQTGWLGSDTWFAHMVHTTPDEVRRLAASQTSVSHCPVSNARLGSGVAPAVLMESAGMTVSLGVDGAASNESADMHSEMHFAWLLHQANQGSYATLGLEAPRVETIIKWASAGGADVLGLRTGRLEPGAAADLGVYTLDDFGHFGSHDPATALVISSGRPTLKMLLCGGKKIVEDGEVGGVDVDRLRTDARRATRILINSQR